MIARDAREVRQLVVNAPSVGESALSPEHWQFLAQAGFALDESSSVDDLEATVLGLVVPRLADLCVVRHPAERVLATGEADWGDVDAQRLVREQ